MTLMLGMLAGAAAGGAVVWAVLARRGSQRRDELANARARADLLDGQVRDLHEEIARAQTTYRETDEKREAAERELAALNEKLRAREQQFAEQKQLLDAAEKRLADTFSAVGAKALHANNEQFIALARKSFENLLEQAKGDSEKRQQAIDAIVKPIRELLEKQNAAIGEIEKKREVAYRGLEEQIKHIAASHQQLGEQTSKLVTALRRPEQRGRWGEMQLRNVCELAGMTAHCDFAEQPQTDDASTRDRPDMTVNLPGNGVIVVDSKVALDAYLDALQPDADRDACLHRHAKQLADHYRRLAAKAYWDQFDRTPKLVVMFVPLESALCAAMEIEPDLHAQAMRRNVLIATPTLLVALLRAVAYGWQQEALAENSRKIADVGRDLYARLGVFTQHLEKLGRNLSGASTAYNSAIGSLERRVLPAARDLKELHATTDGDIEAPEQIDLEVRRVTADELRRLPEEILHDGAEPRDGY